MKKCLLNFAFITVITAFNFITIGAKSTNSDGTINLKIKKLSQTVFAGMSYQGVTFSVINEGTEPISVSNFDVRVDSPGVWEQTTPAYSCMSIPVGRSCEISGTFKLPNANDSTKVYVNLASNGTVIYQYIQDVFAIKQAPSGYLAMRINYPAGGDQKVFAVVSLLNDDRNKNVMVKFDESGMGIKSDDSNVSAKTYSHYAVQVAGPGSTSNLLYIPKGFSGVMYLSMDNTLSDGPPPDITGADIKNRNTRFQTIEFSNDGNITYANLTNVDHVSIPYKMDWVDSNSYSAVSIGEKYPAEKPMTEVLSEMAAALVSLDPEGNSWSKLVQRNAAQEIVRIMAPMKAQNFSTTNLDLYINDLWNFYKQTDSDGKPIHYMYVDVSEVTRGKSCKVRGYVSPTDNLLHFEPLPGYTTVDCPETPWDPNESRVPGTNKPTFTKFTAGDFLKGASGSNFTTWGLNGSYRAVIGRSIVSAQSIGFLPFCSNMNLYYNGDNGNSGLTERLFTKKYFDLYYTEQYKCINPGNTYGEKVLNQYSKLNTKYFDYYNYPYSDAIGRDGTTVGRNALFPMTITIGKMK